MPSIRHEEMWASACVEAALPGVAVLQYDDGSRPRMYDADLVRDGVPFAAMEITSAADQQAIEFWKLVNGADTTWTEPNLEGGWMVTATPTARARSLQRELPDLLRTLENTAEEGVCRAAFERLRALGVLSVNQGATDFVGSIYVTVEMQSEASGGVVPSTGDGLVRWLDRWIREPAQEHNLTKLAAAERPQRHLFVLLPGFTSAPFEASYVLMRPAGPLPKAPPALPGDVTDVWLMSTWTTGDVFHFGNHRWSRSPKVSPLTSYQA